MVRRSAKKRQERPSLPDLPIEMQQEWNEVCKKPVTMKKKARARYLLLECYRPYLHELANLRKQLSNADFSKKAKLRLDFAIRWQVDIENRTDFFGVKKKAPSVLHIADETGQDALFLLRYKHSNPNIIESDIELLLSNGYSQLFVDLSKSDDDIKDGIQKIRENLGIPSPKKALTKSKKNALGQSSDKTHTFLDAIKTLSEQDLYLIYLFSHAAPMRQIKLKYNPKYDSTDSSTSGLITRRIPNLLRFIDPMNYGQLQMPEGFKKITKKEFKKIKDNF